jgi:hypothetical protein
MGSVNDAEAPGDSEPDHGAARVADHQEARDAALDAVEPARLLEGEDEHTTYVDDAVHWTKVYAELLDFKRSLMSVSEHQLQSMGDAAESEVKETDLKVLKAEAARFERRLNFWQERADQLRARSVTDSE